MKRFTWLFAVAVALILAVGVQTSYTQAPASGVPAWAAPTPDPNQPPAETGDVKIPDSAPNAASS